MIRGLNELEIGWFLYRQRAARVLSDSEDSGRVQRPLTSPVFDAIVSTAVGAEFGSESSNLG